MPHQITTEDWTEESTQSATGPDIAIKPLGFGMVEHIGHEAPEHRYRKQVEHRYPDRSEEHTSELQSLMRISYAVLCFKHKKILQITKYYIRSRKKSTVKVTST